MGSRLSQFKLAGMVMQDPNYAKLQEYASKKGHPEVASQVIGSVMSGTPMLQAYNEAYKSLGGMPDELNGDQQRQLGQEVNQAVDSLNYLNKLRTLVNTKDVVGPAYNQGSWLGVNAAKFGALLGKDSTKFQNQSEVEQAASQRLGDVIKSLGGIRSAPVLARLGEQVPSLHDLPDTWNKYLDDKIEATRKSIETMKSQLPKGMSVPEAPAASQAPANNPNVDLSKYKLVSSQAELDALPSGTLVRDAAGNYGPKP
jgi:hypothetical protein